eukprot:TRINITY_DN4976_c0_g1_i1.p1 TRINITY_DN4976_c0_g1~~TRINITY_DN4976_c0_g1_i1.p1  ORF type:complete len:749 (+),score=262.41 TRINITY_DN4976_c0_g1_i1:60-2306(+)
MLDEDNVGLKARYQLAARRSPYVLLGLAVVSLALICLTYDGRRRQMLNEELRFLRKQTNTLNIRLATLGDSIAATVRELNEITAERESARDSIDSLTEKTAKLAKKIREEINSKAEEIKSGQEQDLNELKEKIDKLPKECIVARPPPPTPPYKDPYQYDPGGASYTGNAQPATPVPDPCKGKDTECRQAKVKDAFLHSWNAYKKYAWGHDELMPLSKRPKDWGKDSKGLGLSMLDAISTLWLMDLKDEFHEVRHWVEEELDFDQDCSVSAFEVTIRMVGSMLSAYELSGEKHKGFLTKATQLADRVLWAYNTSSGIPHANINLQTHAHSNPQWTGGSSVLSEFGTVQLELRTLSLHTGNALYDQKATWIMDVIESKAPATMLCPTYYNTVYNRWTSDHVTLGALGDSFYEYLLKQYLLTGMTETRYKDMYMKAVREIVKQLVKRSTPSGQTYVAEYKRGSIFNKMDHLACFTGGMLALGTHLIEDYGDDKADHLKTAEDLAETCYLMYKNQPTGIAPEIVEFRGGSDMATSPRSAYYLLRPEAVETFMYLWRVTRKEKYRDWAWEVFTHIDHWCKVESGGYSGLRNVAFVPPQKDDLQQSFWFAETLKYLYVIFSDDDLLDFKEWVLNTEAHPLRVRKRNPLDVWDERDATKLAQERGLGIDERLRRHQEEFERRRAEGDTDGQQQPQPQPQQAQAANAGGTSDWVKEQERLVRESRERHAQWQREQDAKYEAEDAETQRLKRLQQQR